MRRINLALICLALTGGIAAGQALTVMSPSPFQAVRVTNSGCLAVYNLLAQGASFTGSHVFAEQPW